MCTAYELGKRQGSFPEITSARAIAELLAIEEAILIQPNDPGLVLMPDGNLKTMTWGFRRRMRGVVKKTVMRTIVNTREDKLDSFTWKDAIEKRRCLIPVTGAYEWSDTKVKQTYLMSSPEDGYLWVTGIWEEGDEGLRYSALTTEPNATMAPFHDRMLAVLTMEEIPRYLAGDMRKFSPRAEGIVVRTAENPRARKKEEPPAERRAGGDQLDFF